MALNENPEPHYYSDQQARTDGSPLFYESFELEVPMYITDAGGTAELVNTHKMSFIKFGRLCNLRISFPHVEFPALQPDGASPWCNQSALDLNKAPVRIPRRFCPAITDINTYPQVSDIRHHYGHAQFPLAVVNFGDEHMLAFLIINTVTGRDDTGEVETDKSELKEYGLIKFAHPTAGWNTDAIGPCDFSVTYQTDSATNSIKDGWYSKDVENQDNPFATPPPTVEAKAGEYAVYGKEETALERRQRLANKKKKSCQSTVTRKSTTRKSCASTVTSLKNRKSCQPTLTSQKSCASKVAAPKKLSKNIDKVEDLFE